MLEKSKREGEKRRMRITGTCLLVGTIGLLVGAYVHFQRPSTAKGMGHPNVYLGASMMYSSLAILLLGVLPSDVRAIRVANGLMMFVFAVILVSMVIAQVLFYRRGLAGDIPRLHRSYWTGFANVNNLIQSVRMAKANYLSQRERLDKIWRVFGQWQMGSGLLFLILSAGLLNDVPYLINMLFAFSAYLFVQGSVIAWPNFRVRAQAFLSNRGETRLMAAAVAAAIGNHSPEEAQQKSAKLLRYVTLDKITKEELAENKPNPLLYERSVGGKFGDVDAFISHSWHDSSDEKWDGIQLWRERFKAEKGREPRVWFDKCCIDQLSIDDSLMCLPVHLAACKTFLMIAGPTYTSRMWCIMEIFVFLAAVNDMSRLQCIPLLASPPDASAQEDAETGAPAESSVLELFRAFSIGQCKCYSNDTRDKLLSIIEAGCGTLDDFDALMRAIQINFINKDEELPSFSRGSTTASTFYSRAGSRQLTRSISSKEVVGTASKEVVGKSSKEVVETVVRSREEIAADEPLFLRV
jgi:hypothetical protein